MIRDFIRNQNRDFQDEAEKIARAEIDYYKSAKKIEEYGELNSEG
jgi:hypothetical protein